jgi:hypothetical protein
MKAFQFVIILVFFNLVAHNATLATHIRSLEIKVERENCLSGKHKITLTGYRDVWSPVEMGHGILYLGDGEVVQPLAVASEIIRERISPLTDKITFIILHTYSIGEYVIGYKESNRNVGIMNIPNSANTPFYVETKFKYDPFLGCNSAPIFKNSPVVFGEVGQKATFNNFSSDQDGDSLSYSLVIPMFERRYQNSSGEIENYSYPNEKFEGLKENGESGASFILNGYTGDLSWDAPALSGEYVAAMKVTEWRKIEGQYYQIGYIIREIQFVIESKDKLRPRIFLPEMDCIEIGYEVNFEISIENPSGSPLKIEVFSGLTLLNNNKPVIEIPEDKGDGGLLKIKVDWKTLQEHYRSSPYFLHVKAFNDLEDGTGLATYKTLMLRFECYDIITSLIKKKEESSLVVFPNPSFGKFKIRTNDPLKEEANFIIFNISGNTVESGKIYYKEQQIDLSKYPKGVYFLKISDGKVERLVIK